MNHPSDTPPNGDFARYVERLSAQSALPQRAAAEGAHGLDVGMTPSPHPQGSPERGAGSRKGAPPAPSAPAPGAPAATLLVRVLAAVWGVVLLIFWIGGASAVTLIALLGLGLWAGFQLRKVVLRGGTQKWQQVLEEAARKEQAHRKKQGQ